MRLLAGGWKENGGARGLLVELRELVILLAGETQYVKSAQEDATGSRSCCSLQSTRFLADCDCN